MKIRLNWLFQSSTEIIRMPPHLTPAPFLLFFRENKNPNHFILVNIEITIVTNLDTYLAIVLSSIWNFEADIFLANL